MNDQNKCMGAQAGTSLSPCFSLMLASSFISVIRPLIAGVRLIAHTMLGLALLQPVHAADFTCPAPPDANGVRIGDVPCLINAINTANLSAEADTIFLEVGTYTLTGPATGAGTGFNATGLPVIGSRITIEGMMADTPSAGQGNAFNNGTVIRAVTLFPSVIYRVFNVSPAGNLTLNRVVVRGGLAQFGGGIRNAGLLELILSEVSSNTAAVGGGIHNAAMLVLEQSAIRANSASTFQGTVPTGGIAGGIHNTSAGTVELDKAFMGDMAAFTNGNMADISGGGLVNDGGRVTCLNSAFGFNGAKSGMGFGGGVLNRNRGIVELTNCAFGSNLAFNGGGLANVSSGQAQLCTSQFMTNTGFRGGGVYNNGGGRVTFGCPGPPDFSSFVGNRAVDVVTGQPGQGGAIFNSPSGTVTRGLFTSFANNTPNNCTGVVVPACPPP